jgi:hypothetical protein
VAYQFATVGNNPGARQLVQDLDDDSELGEYIDCMGMFLSTVHYNTLTLLISE